MPFAAGWRTVQRSLPTANGTCGCPPADYAATLVKSQANRESARSQIANIV
ncbi:hypothetical protein [Singulisphaera acidiphila]|uniref:hypothetical protein n=1 Tax=Singulisphaera acidiphila TaxID=466153 RepID=UPI00030B3206|nr:hypothetical protein [Singulisphaera acidiphila]